LAKQLAALLAYRKEAGMVDIVDYGCVGILDGVVEEALVTQHVP
jgi:hypothetical protein